MRGRVKILTKRSGSLPLKSLNKPPSPSLLLQSFLHLLSCHGSLQCPVHYCCHEDDPSVERGTSREGCVMCASRINRLGEGLRRCEGGHQRSWHAISDDGRAGSHVPWLTDRYWWLTELPRGGSAITHVSEFTCGLGPWFASCSCAFPSSDDRERALFSHTHTSLYGCSHPEEHNDPALAGGSIMQQQ
jgi:hypothetical protein